MSFTKEPYLTEPCAECGLPSGDTPVLYTADKKKEAPLSYHLACAIVKICREAKLST